MNRTGFAGGSNFWESGADLSKTTNKFSPVGVRQTTAPSKERGTELAVTVWYPADAGGKPATLGESLSVVE
ncbi:hypothetical protein ASC90_21460 [Rhizobium sp. Root1220]|nr:hypothetical protein ASC90_21460 [Rhizobium sp. Root1220]